LPAAVFPPDVKAALAGAELTFRHQGACPPIAHVDTTEDGEFLSPLPHRPMYNQEIDDHLWDVLTAKPGARAVYTAYTSTPEGGGSAPNRPGRLYCRYITWDNLYKCHALITGTRTLGPWVCETYFRLPDKSPAGYPFSRTWPREHERDIVFVGTLSLLVLSAMSSLPQSHRFTEGASF
jgi:hypothetical protein